MPWIGRLPHHDNLFPVLSYTIRAVWNLDIVIRTEGAEICCDYKWVGCLEST